MKGWGGRLASTHLSLHILKKSPFLNEQQVTQTINDHIQNCTLVTLTEGADRLFEGGGIN